MPVEGKALVHSDKLPYRYTEKQIFRTTERGAFI
jgi:hypothetical protein